MSQEAEEPNEVFIVCSGVAAAGDVEGAQVCRQLERGGHEANQAGQEQQQVDYQHQHHRRHYFVQVKVEVHVEQEQRWVFEQVWFDWGARPEERQE